MQLSFSSTLTKHYQKTVPDLGLSKDQNDPVLEKFLSFLAEDMEKNPLHLQEIDFTLVSSVKELVADVDIDLDSPLGDEDESD